ncbi:tyrosine-protein kinase STYK1-like isoform 2-T2 [Discoglossus pictus]
MDYILHLSSNSSSEVLKNDIGVIVIPVMLSASTLIVVAVIIWKYVKSQNTKNRSTAGLDADGAVNVGATYESFPGFPDSVLETCELPKEWSIQDRVVLCQGHYGPISRACLTRVRIPTEKQNVVVKELSETFSPGEAQDFIDLMKFHVQVCNHENLVKVLWCQTDTSPLCLILKAMNPGNLLRFLWRSREDGLAAKIPLYKMTEKRVYALASQVASGLEYLTGRHNLVHGFVAACNVLIHEDMSIQLCGLGLAAIMHRTGTMPTRRAALVPLKWQSPERLTEGSISEKSDVWSFGILLYEIVTLGAPPYSDLDPSEVLPKLKTKYRLEQPDQCSDSLYETMNSCWTWDPTHRPCFTDLMKKLQNHMSQADEEKRLTAMDIVDQTDYQLLTGITL